MAESSQIFSVPEQDAAWAVPGPDARNAAATAAIARNYGAINPKIRAMATA